MPVSPYVKFQFVNKNVQQTTPQLGVSLFLARTTKGPYDDPSELLNSFSQFQRIFGDEIVPDGSVSNIQKAFEEGSKLRIIRVLGKGATKGTVSATAAESLALEAEEDDVQVMSATPEPAEPETLIKITSNGVSYGFGLVTKGYGDSIGDGDTFQVGFYMQANTLYYRIYSANGQVLEQGPVMTWKTADDVNDTSFDYLALSNFINNSEYISAMITEGSSLDNMIKWLTDSVDNTKNAVTVTVGGSAPTTEETKFDGTVGSAGTDPTAEEWIASLDFIRDYQDIYHVACSHLDQHIKETADQLKVHKAAGDLANELEEFVYCIEVPKYQTHYTQGQQPRDYKSICTWIDTTLGTVGNSKFIAYFSCGLKYYNAQGNLSNCDVMGTVFGLADTSATAYGPWRSFAGMNRGVAYDANGPVSPNYGAPSRYEQLNELAQHYANTFVIKDTPSSGKRTMLWHCFTSQVKQDSYRFLSIVQLSLYLKKSLRPILDKYIEEPNVWSTWKNIYLEGKPIMDNLVDQDAISEYTWMGDQDASSWADLQVNNEADARQGKYKLIIKFKDIVPMQEVTVVLKTDAASNTVNVSFE